MNGSPLSTIVKKCTGRSLAGRSPSAAALDLIHRVSLPAVLVVISIGSVSAAIVRKRRPHARRRRYPRLMLTILTVPKAFRGHIGEVQHNAIESWRALGPDVQIVLVGDEEGVERAAKDAHVEHAGGLARNDRGTPRLDSAFDCAARVARWPLWCLVNADIVLLDDFPQAIERVASGFSDFLLIGESRDLDVAAGTHLSDTTVRSQLRERALDRGRLRGYAALDYFVFQKGLFDPVPPFLVGRACFDNWLVWRARELRRPVVDATRSVVAVHQSHDYSHVPGGLEEAYYGEEARYNEQLAGGREHIYSLHDATHRLYLNGPPVPYWGSIFRAREKARVAKVTIDVQIAARRARRSGLHGPLRLLGVLPEPRTETTPLLDALAETEDVDLDVLYVANAPAATAASTRPLRHVHWFPRSARVGLLDRILGRRYPINWTIWHSFYFLQPDCILIWGWSNFATQAAIAWGIACRVPYLLLVHEDGRSIPTDADGRLRRVLVSAVTQRAAGVFVTGAATEKSMLAHGARSEHVGDLDASEVIAMRLVDAARCAAKAGQLSHALEDRETVPSLRVGGD